MGVDQQAGAKRICAVSGKVDLPDGMCRQRIEIVDGVDAVVVRVDVDVVDVEQDARARAPRARGW